jgi:hypothetical protein
MYKSVPVIFEPSCIKPINEAGYVCRITEFKQVSFHHCASGENINICIFCGALYISQKLLGPKQT